MADCAMIYDWHTRLLRKGKETEYCSVLLRVLPWTVLQLFVLFFPQFGTKFAEVYPSAFWILLHWNGDA